MTSVLVVDDSRFVRGVVGDALTERDFEVATASDGREAVATVRELGPDVVTMDVEMPGLDGIEATEQILAERPTPVVMLAADDDADATLAALASGAVDFVHKGGDEDDVDIDTVIDELACTVEAVADVPRATLVSTTDDPPTGETAADGTPRTLDAGRHRSADVESATGRPEATTERPSGASASDRRGRRVDVDPAVAATGVSRDADPVAGETSPTTVVVGASTGGPSVVEATLRALPTGLGARVLVVQHMPEEFTGRLANRLDRVSDYETREAADGVRVGPDQAVLARGGKHLTVARQAGSELVLRLTDEAPVHNVRPAVDVTMETAAETHGPLDPLVGVVLTGMGSDGASGVAAVAAAGGTAIAQDQSSSPVFGMPETALATGAVDRVASAADLPAAIRDAVCDQQCERQREEVHP